MFNSKSSCDGHMTNPKPELEGKLETAIHLVEQVETEVDLLTLNKAIATILVQRAQPKPAWQKWFCERFEDIEAVSTSSMNPLMPDLS